MSEDEKRRWIVRTEQLFRAGYVAWVQPPGARIRIPQFRVYATLVRVHLWFWVRGIEL